MVTKPKQNVEVIEPKSRKQEMFINSVADITVFGGAAGSGKALRNGTKVLTSKGWINIEDAKIGDSVITPKDGVQTITGVHPQGMVDIYKVTLQDGATLDVCGNHLFKVHQAINDHKPKLVTALELKDLILKEDSKPSTSRKRPYRMDLCGDVELPKQDTPLPLHPYILGSLLGDGGMSYSGTYFTTADEESAEEIARCGGDIVKHKSKYQYGIRGVKDITSALGVRVNSDKKFIPRQYLTASVEDRYALLQGLMDTDGHAGLRGSVRFCSTSKQLALDVQELVRSLGGTATLVTEQPTCSEAKYVCKTAYILHIRHRDCSSLFRLQRKKIRCSHREREIANQIMSVEFIGRDYATCISITGSDRQFIAENYVVSHNSYLGVMDFLQYIHLPNFRGLMTRRTTPQLKGSGGLHEKAEQLFKAVDKKVRWKDKDGYFLFSSGARVYMRHFENLAAKDNFQGAEVNAFLVDEGQQYEEAMVEYLMSRMRNPRCPEVKPRMKITCNPDYNSFLRKWLEWYLDPTTGIPLPERDGHVRWFIRRDGEMLWADSKEECFELYGKKDLPLEHLNQIKPISFQFLAANVYDNPVLCELQPEYVGWLESLPRVEKARLLYGSWYAREESSGYFNRDWVQKIKMPPLHVNKRVRAWDISGTLPSEKNKNPDYTAGVLMSVDKNNLYYVEDVVRDQRLFGGVFELILETARRDGSDTLIIIPCDPGSAGKAYAASLVRDLAEYGFEARLQTTNKSKITRFAPFSAVAEAKLVHYVDGAWNDMYLDELEQFDGSRNIKDDMVDATSDAFARLNSNLVIPAFTLPDLTKINPLKL